MNQDNFMDHFRQEFFQEAREILEAISDDLLKLEADPENDELLNAVFRGIHTIKGSAGSFELMVISDFTHHLEGLLNALRDGALTLSSDLVDVILSGSDQIGEMIEICAAGGTPDQNGELIERMVACLPAKTDGNISESKGGDGIAKEESNMPDDPDSSNSKDEHNDTAPPLDATASLADVKSNTSLEKEKTKIKKAAAPEAIHDALIQAAEKGNYLFKITLNYTSAHFENGYDPMVFLNHLFNSTSFYHVELPDPNPMPGLDIFEPLNLYLTPILYVATDLTKAGVLDLLFDEELVTVEDLLEKFPRHAQQKNGNPTDEVSKAGGKGDSTKSALMDEIIGSDEAMSEFVDGAMEMLQVAEKAVITYEIEGATDSLDELFRAVHNIKGDADLMGFENLVHFSHAFESFLDLLRSRKMKRSTESVELALQAVDFIKGCINDISHSRTLPDLGSLYKSIRKYVDHVSESASDEEAPQPPGHWIDDESLRATYIEQILQCKAIFLQFLDDFNGKEGLRQGIAIERTLQDIQNASQRVNHETLHQKAGEALKAHHQLLKSGKGASIDPAVDEQQMTALLDPVLDTIEELMGEPRRIGEILVLEGKIKESDLSDALASQKPVGQILVESGKVSEKDLSAALSKQKLISTAKKPKAEESPTTVKTMRVDETKVESFSNLVGEMLIARNTYSYLLNRLTLAENPDETLDAVKELKENLHLFSRLTNDVQHGVISLRMIPVRGIFQKFARVVRDISRKQNKMIHMMTDGEEIEIDKKVADLLSDPLIHLIRNACDHGIETPLERRKAGKPDKGTVLLKASREGSNIVIRINDDGRGINRKKLLEKAEKQGLNFTSVDDPGLLDMIFMPGLSTADKVTDVSGRGVGMDVVKTTIQSLGGGVSVMSEEGQGSQLTLTLPTSMGIDTVLLVEASKNAYAIPIAYILETLKVRPDSFIRAGDQLMFHYRGEVLSAHFLDELMAGEEETPFREKHTAEDAGRGRSLGKSDRFQGGDPSSDEISMIIVKTSREKYGVIVDRLDKNMELAVKPLPDMLSELDIISGISILGDGRVLLVVNPEKLAQ